MLSTRAISAAMNEYVKMEYARTRVQKISSSRESRPKRVVVAHLQMFGGSRGQQYFLHSSHLWCRRISVSLLLLRVPPQVADKGDKSFVSDDVYFATPAPPSKAILGSFGSLNIVSPEATGWWESSGFAKRSRKTSGCMDDALFPIVCITDPDWYFSVFTTTSRQPLVRRRHTGIGWRASRNIRRVVTPEGHCLMMHQKSAPLRARHSYRSASNRLATHVRGQCEIVIACG
mmetsp:Transcript_46134/g.114725  ORF Transcript_46134/g.114725 Transcript_46134/m.114725 type:complete len:231 (+) Transcript_46134:1518-2210(+)